MTIAENLASRIGKMRVLANERWSKEFLMLHFHAMIPVRLYIDNDMQRIP